MKLFYQQTVIMPFKGEMTSREHKMISSAKKNDLTGKYSSKHIRNHEELMRWKKRNNSAKGGKSRHSK